MTSPTFTKVVSKLATLSEDVQDQVLNFIELLEENAALGDLSTPQDSGSAKSRYPLRGEVYRYDKPFEPAVPPEAWNAVGEQA